MAASLNLKGDSRLNYLKFIRYWKKEMKQAGSTSISDEVLQGSMSIWKNVDEDGMGLTLDKITQVVKALIESGLVTLSEDGHFLSNK